MSLIGRTKLLKGKVLVSFIGAITLFSLSSCQDITQAEKSTVRNASKGGTINGDVLVYKSNPVVLKGNSNLTAPNWGDYLSYESISADYYLQSKCDLKLANYATAIETTSNCFEVYKNDQADPIQKNVNSWNYPVDSDEFYQVNVFYHSKKVIDRFLDSMQYNHQLTHDLSSLFIPPSNKYNPTVTKSFWLGQSGVSKTLKVYSKCEFEGADINAYFDPAEDTMCLGWNANQSKLHMAQDPGVLYHEMGHVFVKIMMNQRNVRYDQFGLNQYPSIDFKSDLGTMDYDEAGAINEGIADFFTYYMTGRRYIGEWGMDRIPYLIQESQGFVGQKFGRPMDEDDTTHVPGISGDIPGEKVSYPEYINYNAHSPTTRYEGEIHYAGQIVSHYLARLTETFKTTCTTYESISEDIMPNTTESKHFSAATLTLLLINETLAEIGDMTAKGSDFFNSYAITNPTLQNVFFTNLNIDEAYLWAHQVTPPDMRRFFKLFAKNLKHYISNSSGGFCPGFTTDMSEQLLDEYGLLLFKSYGDAGQGTLVSGATATDVKYEDYDMVSLPYTANTNVFSAFSASSEVSELNRKETILVSKDYLDLPTDTRATAYVFDGRSEVQGIINQLTFEGEGVALSTGLAGVEYNNDNIKISPGEIVGVSLNLVNSSNSTMSGVQILANDWDHMKLDNSASLFVNRQENLSVTPFMNQIANWSPCQIDGWPLDTEGGVVWDPNTPGTDGDCEHITKTNKKIGTTVSNSVTHPYYELDSPQPICLVQYSDENETKWVSQDFFRKQVLGLEDHECLNNEASGANFNPNECLIRMLPGADQAVFGRIEPQKTWLETISVGNDDPRHASSNITLMEVNKWIQPGTTFNCRFRARFTNCQDCFNENGSGEDYKDYEYAGMKPFKVINFSFKVID